MNSLRERVEHAFQDRFSDDYVLVKSPGRVNLIGGHTDYNEGFVLPAAIDKHIFLAMAVNDTSNAQFYSVDKDEFYEADLTSALHKSGIEWPDYLLGVIDQLKKHGYNPGGFNCVFGGNVPIGAGMSSSAALEGGVLYGLSQLFDLDMGPVEMAKIAQKAENEFVGVQCGIMDQFVSLNAKKDHVMKLDCRTLEYDFFPFQYKDIHFVVCDTRVRRELVSSAYNERRSQCEQGVKVLQQYEAGIKSLRDVSRDLLEKYKKQLDPVVYKRCRYIIDENERVLEACRDLENQDLQAFGERMFAAHQGLKDEYEVSCKELDILVEEARNIKGVKGARMMGGGFGGCTINLIEDEHLQSFTETIAGRYEKRTAKKPKIYQAKVSAGTHIEKSSKAKSLK